METPSLEIPTGKQIIDDILATKVMKTQPLPCRSNWPSKIGHPCERFLFYLRTRWMDQKKFETSTILMFEAGDLFEDFMIKQLKGAGYYCSQQQRPFNLASYHIGGRIDLVIKLKDGTEAILECKGMNPYSWREMDSVDDMLNSKHDYVRLYPAQLQIYMFALGIHKGFFCIVNKVSMMPKFIEVAYDEEYCKTVLDRVDRVNGFVMDSIEPDRMEFNSVFCPSCAFRHVCCPPQLTGEGMIPEEDFETAKLLARREELAAMVAEYNQINRTLDKSLMKGKDRMVVGEQNVMFTVTWKERERKGHEVKPCKYWEREIVRIAGPSNDNKPELITELETFE